MGLWVEERKALSRAAEGEVAVPTLGPVFSFLPSSPPPLFPSSAPCLFGKGAQD